MTTLEKIQAAKTEAGRDSYLWLQSTAGDVILWPSEAASENDDGKNAMGRWQLSSEEEDELIALGICDEVN